MGVLPRTWGKTPTGRRFTHLLQWRDACVMTFKRNVITVINIDSIRDGVLEDTFWSPWPWPRSLKSSKIALSSAQGQHYFWTVEISLENAKNLAENMLRLFFWFPLVEIAWKKFLNTFFLFFWRTLAFVFLVFGLGLKRVCPWPQEGLSLASIFFCAFGLGLEPCVLDSTSGQYTEFYGHNQTFDQQSKTYCFGIDIRLLFLVSIATTTGMNRSVKRQGIAN